MVSTSTSDAFLLVESTGTGTSSSRWRFFSRPPWAEEYCHARMVLGMEAIFDDVIRRFNQDEISRQTSINENPLVGSLQVGRCAPSQIIRIWRDKGCVSFAPRHFCIRIREHFPRATECSMITSTSFGDFWPGCGRTPAPSRAGRNASWHLPTCPPGCIADPSR